MTDKIYWTDVTQDMKVTVEGDSYFADGKLVYWLGEDRYMAQMRMADMAKKRPVPPLQPSSIIEPFVSEAQASVNLDHDPTMATQTARPEASDYCHYRNCRHSKEKHGKSWTVNGKVKACRCKHFTGIDSSVKDFKGEIINRTDPEFVALTQILDSFSTDCDCGEPRRSFDVMQEWTQRPVIACNSCSEQYPHDKRGQQCTKLVRKSETETTEPEPCNGQIIDAVLREIMTYHHCPKCKYDLAAWKIMRRISPFQKEILVKKGIKTPW